MYFCIPDTLGYTVIYKWVEITLNVIIGVFGSVCLYTIVGLAWEGESKSSIIKGQFKIFI